MHLSYLPLAHIFETVVMNLMLSLGGAVGFYQVAVVVVGVVVGVGVVVVVVVVVEYSLLTITAHHSLLTTHHSLLTTHYSPLSRYALLEAVLYDPGSIALCRTPAWSNFAKAPSW